MLSGAPRSIDRASTELAARLRSELTGWEGHVLQLVRDQAGNRRAVARTLSAGINGVGLALMIAMFSHTVGLTGGGAGVAAGTAAVSQPILSAVLWLLVLEHLLTRAAGPGPNT